MNSDQFSEQELEKIKSIKIGKWDIISEYHRIDWKEKGYDDEEAKIHGTLIAILGYKARTGKSARLFELETQNGEKGKTVEQRGQQKWVTSKEFDKVIKKMGEEYYQRIFSPAIQNLYKDGYSYEGVKKAVNIPAKIGAKVTLDKFIPFLKRT